MVVIETIIPEYYNSVSKLIQEAFTHSEHGYGDEAKLVKELRQEETYSKELEVVAFTNDRVVGHGLLSEVIIKNNNSESIGLCLAPLSVLPSYQCKGIGGAIINELEKRAVNLKYNFISILGSPEYYTRFEYVPASKYNIKAPFSVPDDLFMIKEIRKDRLKDINGTLVYPKVFS